MQEALYVEDQDGLVQYVARQIHSEQGDSL
jgi:hypothetical protein